jgi:threonine synthase
LRHAATHRSEYMWPWESEPRSLATGILDDETYDWLAVVEGMVVTGGWPLVVSEELLAEAHRLGREHTGIRADPTGTAGLAGLMALVRAGVVAGDERVAVLFTGVER